MLGLSHQYRKSMHRRRTPSVMNWAIGLEKVLEDPIGLNTFKEFLEREFSSENIKFWIVCEHYKNQIDKFQRKKLARDIIDYHLRAGAPEAINIDSQTRQNAIEGLHEAPPDLFVPAQKQIFNLMKFDCYQRFLKSDLFARSLTAEKLGKPLPCQEFGTKSPKKTRSRSKSCDRNRILHSTKLNLNLTHQIKSDVENKDNLKGTDKISPASSEESSPKDELDEKKRKSLLPWQKGRAKSTEPGRSSSQSPVLRQRGSNFRRSKRKAAEKKRCTDTDNGRSSTKELEIPGSTIKRISFEDKYGQYLLPPQTTDGVMTQSLMPDVLKDTLKTNKIDKNTSQITTNATRVEETKQKIDHSSMLSNFCDKDIITKQFAIIRLELPSKKVIAVKAKPEKTGFEVLKPVLKKYGFEISNVNLYFDGSDVPFNTDNEIRMADRRKLCVRLRDVSTGTEKSSKVIHKQIEKCKKERKDVTSNILEEIVKGKICFYYDELGILDLDNNDGKRISPSSNEDCSLSVEDVPRRNSFTVCKEDTKSNYRHSKRASIHEGMGIKIELSEAKISQEISNTTPRRMSNKKLLPRNVHYRDSYDFTAIWKRTQKRIDDQRGLELNCELPEFLRIRSDSSPAELASFNS